jgi:hypothetical protein
VQLREQQTRPTIGKGMLLVTLLMSFVSVTGASYVGEVQSGQFIKPIGATWSTPNTKEDDLFSLFRLE